MAAQLLWFRRDLRVRDHPALVAAAEAGEVLPVFVLDPAFARAGTTRSAALLTALHALHEATDGALVVRSGAPEQVIPALAAEAGATAAHISGETTPAGRRRDRAVERALAVPLVATGTPYAVSPGRVQKPGGDPYRVFTPFSRAWLEHGWRAPAPRPSTRWARGVESEPLPAVPAVDARLDWAAEEAALERWAAFLDGPIDRYDEQRDRPDLDGTSRMSIALKLGAVHPRTLLADLDRLAGQRSAPAQRSMLRYRAELAWREFYADLVWHFPRSAWHDFSPELTTIAYDEPDARFEAWQQGRTGFPMVDAGMRQMRAEGWMHNRLRMLTASFLTKDLHVWWGVGARHFLDLLADGDLASNNHGWQWVAGTGTDAAPYFRVFNPVLQGQQHDPEGDYVRRWVPELRHVPGAAVHEPWKVAGGYAHGYPERILDHGAERKEALARYEAARA